MIYSEHEEFLNTDDFRKIGQEINQKDLEEINGHPMGDGEKEEDKQIILEATEDDVISIMPDGTKRYRTEDPGEAYKAKPVEKTNDLLQQTPEYLRKTLLKETLVQRIDNYGRFRRGFTQDKDSIAKRILDEKGRPIVNKNLTEYMALTEIKYGYRPQNSNNLITYLVKPGEKFWSPRSSEAKKQK
jgi:hypothetical protein